MSLFFFKMVHDLYILMITAGVVSLLFKLLKQPVVLGYIVAGVLVGPNLFLYKHASPSFRSKIDKREQDVEQAEK